MEILNQQQCVFVDKNIHCMNTVHSGVNGGEGLIVYVLYKTSIAYCTEFNSLDIGAWL